MSEILSVATKVIKDEIIRVRVTSEQKEKLKKIAKEKGKSMSEILSVATENEIKNYEEKQKNYKKICERAVATEKKIQEIKFNLEQRKLNNKKSSEKKLRFFFPLSKK
ncbi:CopG family transcriptional regulator [Clostridium perfringens]